MYTVYHLNHQNVLVKKYGKTVFEGEPPPPKINKPQINSMKMLIYPFQIEYRKSKYECLT